MYDNIEMTGEQQRKLGEGKNADEPATPQQLPPIDTSRRESNKTNLFILGPCLVAIVAIIALGAVAGSRNKNTKKKCDCNCFIESSVSSASSSTIENMWTEIIPSGRLPPERLAHAAETVDNEYLYIHGGMYGTGNVSYADLWRYHEPTDSWEEIETENNDGPGSRLHHSMVNMNNQQLILFGGFNVFNTQTNHDSYDDLYSLDLVSLQWTRLGPSNNPAVWPSKRGAHDAVYINGLMYMFGGFETIGSTGHLAEFWSYDPREKVWTDLTPEEIPDDDEFPVGRIGFTMADGGDGNIYIFGGSCSDTSISDSGQCGDFWKYEPFTDTWTRLYPTGDSPEPRRATHGDIDIYGLLFQYGGVSIQNINSTPTITMFDDLHVYDPTSNMWMRLYPNYNRDPKPPAVFGHSVSRLGTRLVIFGGRIGSPTSPGSNILWEYEVITPSSYLHI